MDSLDIFAAVQKLGVLVRQLQGALAGKRLVSGIVTAAGAAGSSGAWTVSHPGTGDYTVTFTTAFSATPAVVVGIGETSGVYFVKLHPTTPPSASAFRVAVFDSGGAAVNGIFTFIASGPP